MQVWTYPEKEMAEFGARGWEVEWWTLRDGAKQDAEGDYDWDNDLESNSERFPTREAAVDFAKQVALVSHFGVAQLQEQVVDWYVEEERVAEWTNIGSAEEVAP